MSKQKLYCSTPDEECPLLVDTIDGHENPLYYCQGDVRGPLDEEYYTAEEALKNIDWLDEDEVADLIETDPTEITRYQRNDYIPRPDKCAEVYPDKLATFKIPDITESKDE